MSSNSNNLEEYYSLYRKARDLDNFFNNLSFLFVNLSVKPSHVGLLNLFGLFKAKLQTSKACL